MLPFKLVYHDGYDLRLRRARFSLAKIPPDSRRARSPKAYADPADILVPEPATDEDMLRVHTRGMGR